MFSQVNERTLQKNPALLGFQRKQVHTVHMQLKSPPPNLIHLNYPLYSNMFVLYYNAVFVCQK